MNKICVCVVAALALLFTNKLSAEEGFWLARQLQPDSSVLREISADRKALEALLPLQRISQVVARIGDCSAAFVSENGLLITSAHCIESFLQQPAQNSVTQDSRTAEFPLAGLQVHLLQQTQDVTVSINRQLSNEITAQSRADKLQQIRQKLEADCQQRSRLRCELKSLHHGLEYHLQQYRTLSDVRLVYHPLQQRETSGRFWPRYGTDFVILRAYFSAGGSEGYAEDNQPYHSAFVRLSERGVTEQELILSPSFSAPGRRYATATEIRFQFEQLYPRSLQFVQQALQLIAEMAPAGSEQGLQYVATVSTLQQQSASLQAMLQQYKQSSLLASKLQRQQALVVWINSSPLRQQLYGPTLERQRLLLNKLQQMQQRDVVLGYLQYAQLPSLARQLYENALQRYEPQARLRQQLLHWNKHYDQRVDMELALHFLAQYAQLPAPLRLPALDQYFALNDGFNREIVRHKLSAMYRGTRLADESVRLAWLDRSVEQFRQSADPLINFAVAMQETAKYLAAERAQLNNELTSARAALMEVLIAYNDANGNETYAEANGLMHFSLGRVNGYQPIDAVWYQPFSHLSGLAALQNVASEADDYGQRSSAVNMTDNVVVNFLSSTDSCSNYLGAPSFNVSAELVGVMYSGVQENLLADWHYDAHLSRAVHVDSRFIIWQLRQSETGQLLLDELLH